MKIIKLMMFLFLLGGSHVGYGQDQSLPDTLRLDVYFHQGSATFDGMFRGNSGRIDAFMSEMRALQPYNGVSFRGLRIIGGASPEGNTDFQKVLSARRGEHVASLLESYGLSGVYPVEFASLGIDWEGLARLVERSAMPYRSAVLDILYHTPEWIKRDGKVVDGRKRQLQMVAGGRAWHYMEAHFFPELRRARVEYLYSGAAPWPAAAGRVDTIVVSRRDTVVVVRKDTVVVVQRDTVVASPSRPKYPFYMSLKTNLLYDVALVPNVGAEFYLGRGWSLGGSWMYAWWNSDRRHRYWRTYGGELNLRKYFGRRASEKPLTGHHLGLYGQMVTYDFETGGTGYQSKLSYGGGIEYGYSLPVGRRLNLDFSVGVGYLGGEYKKYDPEDGHYVWKETRRRHWFGPTKAEVSLIWLIGRGNSNEKKGSKR